MGSLLTFDLGNTHLTLGWWREQELCATWRLSTQVDETADEYGVKLYQLLDAIGGFKENCHAVGCSVVPSLESTLAAAAQRYLNVKLIWLTAADVGIPIKYDPPESVGRDRLVNMRAAKERFRQPVIVVDFGTATTVDALSRQGVYVGGAIMAGIETAAQTLWKRAARLAAIDLDVVPETMLGQNTTDSMRAGLVWGAALAVDGAVERIWQELGETTPVVATGGLSALVCRCMNHVDAVEPELTLRGLMLSAQDLVL